MWTPAVREMSYSPTLLRSAILGHSVSFAFTHPTVTERWQFDLTIMTSDRLEGELTIEDLGTGSFRRREALLVRR